MRQKQYLIIGGSGEAGQSALEELRNSQPNALLVATTTGSSEIGGADITLTNISADHHITQNISSQLNSKNISQEWEALIYTPALGEVGYPIRQTSKEALSSALSISYDPLVLLEKEFKPKLSIGYSAFYWLPHTLSFYGSMGYVKLIMDEWALTSPSNRKIIRAGTFYSKSVRGISLILQRSLKTTQEEELLDLKNKFQSSQLKFQDFFLEYAWNHEREYFADKAEDSPYRATTRSDLGRGLRYALQIEEPIITVLGDWTWKENQLPYLPDWFQSKELL
ncbi:hypothetical protein [Leptospira idonii]|uniref:SDR family NAD(P)-dependent oxidoreductase n=1 Tax=Leptospira idonii TaxID=1193500 RepID=A0A4R9LWT1_9LEPT|nr:hypothetical protein [Leptospira idonii]TGN17329.1 hypothetical protein EHS15_17485 [Leptospira idonii]